MCGFWKRLSAGALVLTLAIPAPALAAGASDDSDKLRKGVDRPVASPATVSSPVDADSILLSGTPAPTRREVVPDIRWRDEIARATSAVAQQTGLKGTARPPAPSRRMRAQYGGGGGKGAMVSMILTTVISLGATLYLLKYMRDQQNNDEGGDGGN
jgi:hypothetical protein